MNVLTDFDRQAGSTVRAHSLGRSILLHLAPGAAAAGVYIALLPVARQLGMPTIAALAACGLLAVAPVQLGLLALHRRRHPTEPAVLLTARRPLPRILGWAMLEVALAALAFLLATPLTNWLRRTAFGWWPEAWLIDPGTRPEYSTGALIATALLMVLGTVLVAPIVEEYYFRGYLLPRLPPRLGRSAPLAHATLFAAYHLWTPWLAPTRILAILPLSVIALRTRDIRIGMTSHMILNSVDVVVLVLYLGSAR